jgi:hypothetical protein
VVHVRRWSIVFTIHRLIQNNKIIIPILNLCVSDVSISVFLLTAASRSMAFYASHNTVGGLLLLSALLATKRAPLPVERWTMVVLSFLSF